MRSLPKLAAAFVVLLSLASAGCSTESSNAAPVLDSVESPLVIAETDGAYRIPVTVLFHDNDLEVVTKVRYRLEGPTDVVTEGEVDIEAPNPSRESADVTIVVPGSFRTLSALDGQGDDEGGSERRAGRGHGRRNDDRDDGTRALTLKVVDGRGAESRPVSWTLSFH